MKKSYRECRVASIITEKFTQLLSTFLLFSLLNPVKSYAYSLEQFKTELSSPLEHTESRSVLLKGGALTLILVIQRDNLVDPLSQKYGEEEQPMGDLAHFGDIMGQWVPNLSYMGYQYWFSNDPKSMENMQYMFKTTAYAGITTVALKLIVNQRRPNKGDRRSFPSGHTATAFAFAGVISNTYDNTWARVGAYTMATIVGLSRINDHAHYLHDVVFGASLGIAYARALKESPYNNSVRLMPMLDNNSYGVSMLYQFD